MVWIAIGNFVSRVLFYMTRIVTASSDIAPTSDRSPSEESSPHSDTAGASTASYTQRPHRRSHRRPLTQPSRPIGLYRPEHMIQSTMRNGRVPVEYYRHPNRFIAWIQRLRVNFFLARSSPKPAFQIMAWSYDPATTATPGITHSNSGAFIVSFRLRRTENRWHLRRTFQSGKVIDREARLIAVASVKDLVDKEAWVRCLVVNPYTLSLPKDRIGWCGVHSADPIVCNGPTVYRSKHKDVPDDAMWLIVPDPDHSPPLSVWGQQPHRYECHPFQMALRVWALDERAGDNTQQQTLRRSRRKIIAALWTVFGPGMIVFMMLAASTSLLTQPTVDRELLIGGPLLYLLAYLSALAASLFSLGWRTTQRRSWTRRESQALDEWTGGTTDCLTAGTLLRRGLAPRRQDWASYWNRAV